MLILLSSTLPTAFVPNFEWGIFFSFAQPGALGACPNVSTTIVGTQLPSTNRADQPCKMDLTFNTMSMWRKNYSKVSYDSICSSVVPIYSHDLFTIKYNNGIVTWLVYPCIITCCIWVEHLVLNINWLQ